MTTTSTPVFQPFRIGNVLIPNPLVLAPMAGITDPVFRPVIKRMGAGLISCEMVSCMALRYNNKKTHFMLDYSPDELPVAMQLFGSDSEAMAEGAKLIESIGVSIVDINLGCSVPKVAKAGAGAVVCRDLPLLTVIMEKMVKAVSIPVTVKIRKGWSQDEISAFEVCRIARECGISAITIHGRTSGQKFSGKADRDFVKELRNRVDLPLIGNGDIRNPEQVKEMLEYTGCDGVMIGRETYSNPWIFRDALDCLQGNPKKPAPSFNEIRELILELQKETIARYGDRQGTKRMRKFAAWFTRGLPDSTFFRDRVFKVESDENLQQVVENYFYWLLRAEN